jgi:predicted ester cyclase
MAVADELLDAAIAPRMKAIVTQIRAALRNIDYEFHEQIEAGDTVVTRWTCRATHVGEIFGVAPTGRRIELPGVCIDTVVRGRLVEMRGVENWFAALMSP